MNDVRYGELWALEIGRPVRIIEVPKPVIAPTFEPKPQPVTLPVEKEKVPVGVGS